MTADARDYSLVDLTLREGMDVVAFGRIEGQGISDAVTLIPLHPWEPDLQGWSARGHVRVVAESSSPDIPDGAVVRVQGRWTGSHLIARRRSETLPRAWPRGRRNAVAGHLLRRRRPSDTAWFYVLYVTPELAELIERTPLRASVQVAITPSL
ncbi:hypothetical protein GCM10017690_09770 [Microbacterium terregens]|jgi:hypothetical protein